MIRFLVITGNQIIINPAIDYQAELGNQGKWFSFGGWNGLDNSKHSFGVGGICISHFTVCCKHFQLVTICNRLV